MIAVVSNGQIVETGTHTELMEKRGEYFKLVMLQNFQEKAEEEEMTSELEIGSIISDTERGMCVGVITRGRWRCFRH